jgi:hypothetical protein
VLSDCHAIIRRKQCPVCAEGTVGNAGITVKTRPRIPLSRATTNPRAIKTAKGWQQRIKLANKSCWIGTFFLLLVFAFQFFSAYIAHSLIKHKHKTGCAVAQHKHLWLRHRQTYSTASPGSITAIEQRLALQKRRF